MINSEDFFICKIKQTLLTVVWVENLVWKVKAYFIKRNRVRSYVIRGVKEYCLQKEYSYHIIEQKEFRNVCVPKCYEGNEEQIYSYKCSETYIAELQQIEVIGGTSAIFAQKYCLWDAAAYNYDKRYEFIEKCLDNIYGIHLIVKNNKVFWEGKLERQNVQEGIFLVGTAHDNYFHFTMEIASRLFEIDKVSEYRTLPIFVDQAVLGIPQFLDLLKTINIYNHPIISLESFKRYFIKRLIVFGPSLCVPMNFNKGVQFLPSDLNFRKTIIDNFKRIVVETDSIVVNRKIYLSRRNSKNQRIANEEEVTELFALYGFETVFPEEMTFIEQVKMFNQSQWVIGASGAAFTNIIYCQKGTKIAIFWPTNDLGAIYATLAFQSSLKPIILKANVLFENEYSALSQWKVDVPYCERFLKEYM